MNIFIAIILLLLESALIFAFAADFPSGFLFPALLPLLLLRQTARKTLRVLLVLTCTGAAVFLAALILPMVTSIMLLMFCCQLAQLVNIFLAMKYRLNSFGLFFGLAGIFFSYIAYSRLPIVTNALFSNILGTAILLLAILSSGGPVTPKNRHELYIRTHGLLFRHVILSVLICSSIAIASWLAPSVEYASEEMEYWISGLSFGRRAEKAHTGTRSIKQVAGPFLPSVYLSGGNIELKKRYDIKLPHRPEIHLLMHEDAARRIQRNDALYIKCRSFDYFDAEQWSSSLPGTKLIKDEDDGKADGTIILNRELRNPVTYSVMFQSYASRILPCISEVSAMEFRVVEKTQNNVFYSPVSLDHLPLLSYTVTSSDVRWHDIVRNRRNIGDPGEEYIEMPLHPLSGRIARLTREVIGVDDNMVISVEKLLRHIQDRCKYSLKTENRSDMHPIDNFLFEEKRGHCELFASSFVLMLRSIGVPSRMTCGYSGGEYDRTKDLYTFYQDNAHAWVEIYLEEYGWVLIDPTPPEQTTAGSAPKLANFRGSFFPESYVQLNALVNIGFPIDDETLIRKTKTLYEKMTGILSSPVSISFIAVLTGIIMAVLIRKPQKDHLGDYRALKDRSIKKMPDYFRLFCRYFSRMGYPLKRGQTPREYIAYLKKHFNLGDEYDRMIEYFEQVCYGRKARLKSVERQFSKIIRRRKAQR